MIWKSLLVLAIGYSLLPIGVAGQNRTPDDLRYHFKKGFLYFGKMKIGDSLSCRAIFHANLDFVTLHMASDPLFPNRICYKGSYLFNVFEKVSYDPRESEFQVITDFHARDKTTLFYVTIGNDGHPHGRAEYHVKFKSIGPFTDRFEEYPKDARYCTDGKLVYYQSQIIKGADPDTFMVLSDLSRQSPIPVELESGLIFQHHYQLHGLARDQSKVYWGDKVLEGIDPNKVSWAEANRILVEDELYEIIHYRKIKKIHMESR